MPPINNPYITISGLPTYEVQKITFPSGVFGVPVDAELISANATFGFNSTPHRLDLEYAPSKFSYEVLPQIGSGIALYIGNEFFFSGRIKHADYSKSIKGKVLNISIEDIREDLNDFYVDTYGVFGTFDAPAINLIDVRYWYLKEYVESRALGRSRVIRDLELLEQQGASYRQIYEAIKYFEEQAGTVNDLLNKIPKPEVIESQLPEDPDAYRWKFRGEPLTQVFSRIFEDVSYEWYWNMSEQRINVINRKFAVNISKQDIPIPTDTSPVISLRYGYDEGERPTTVKIYGAEMEGLVGSGLLMTQSGAQALSTSQYDLGIEVGKLSFKKGWKAKLKYFGPDGTLKEYSPNDRELSMALKGMEYWAMHHGMDNRIANSTPDSNTGITTTQRSITGSGIGLIQNRRQEDREWIVEWYNKVRTFAQNHYGRTYVLSDKSPLYRYIDDIEVIPAAWCNIENLTDEGSFEEHYKISLKYKWLAPFWEADANKMRGWALFPGKTKWGIDGEGTPASFTEWNENVLHQYVPIEARKWDTSRKKFEEDFLEELNTQEKGILVRLPNIAWEPNTPNDEGLKAVHRLGAIRAISIRETSIDIPNPFKIVKVFENISNVSIPIKVKRRYGYSFPEPWASGTGTAVEIQIRDDLAPWNYEPRGTQTSVQLMNAEARSALAGRIVNRNIVTFAEVQRVGLPSISFDSFSNQSLTEKGYGIIKHGVTSLNLTHSVNDWWQTKYNIKSHFPEFVKAKPIKRGIGEDFNFVIKRFNDDIIRRPRIPHFEVPGFSPPVDDGRNSIKSDSGIEHTVERSVVITDVFNRGENEYYLGIDINGIRWPRALDANFGGSDLKIAHCVDGFLQIGMQSVYHLEKAPDGSVVHYFTGGVPLEAGRIVELITVPKLAQGVWTASVRTLPSIVTNPQTGQTQVVQPFSFFNVPFLAQQAVDAGMSLGDKIMLSGHGNKKGLVPDGDYGPGAPKDGDAFLVNTSSPSDLQFAFVTGKPDATTGRGGKIRTIDVSGGTTYTDGIIIAGNTYNIFFVGCEPSQIQINDFGIVKQFRESGGGSAFRLYVAIQKPTFQPTGAFNQ